MTAHQSRGLVHMVLHLNANTCSLNEHSSDSNADAIQRRTLTPIDDLFFFFEKIPAIINWMPSIQWSLSVVHTIENENGAKMQANGTIMKTSSVRIQDVCSGILFLCLLRPQITVSIFRVRKRRTSHTHMFTNECFYLYGISRFACSFCLYVQQGHLRCVEENSWYQTKNTDLWIEKYSTLIISIKGK